MVVGLLGILKAGGAYVPLDPKLPDDRLSFMLSDVKPRVVLTEQSLHRGVFGSDPVLLDSDWELIARESKENPNKKLSPRTLAYVMYTSGSTGKPKGVLIEHGSVVNLLRSMQREPGLKRDDAMLALAIISFDMATPEMYLPLISGARMVIATSEDAVDGSRLWDLLSKSGVTSMQATPATCRLLLAAGWQGSPGLKILCGAEAVPAELARELTARSNSVWNVYGPTETTVWSTVYRVTGREEGVVPIGRPIANTSIYILDSHSNPVPVNVDRRDLHRRRRPCARVSKPSRIDGRALRYQTDWSQTSRASCIVLATWADSVPMARSSIWDGWTTKSNCAVSALSWEKSSHVLASHATLSEAVVAVTGEGEQQKLCAYVVVTDGNEAPSAGELRRYLRAKLPEYMVPTSYWRVERLPLLRTGKVNRGALAGLSATPLQEEAELIPPRNEIEAKLADIWQKLLKVEQVGIEQNFFELGGHSLLALQMMARIRRTFEVELQVRSVFEAPTIAALGLELEKAQATGVKARTPVFQRHHDADTADATKEALLMELRKLSLEEARKFIESAVGRKTQR